MSYIKELLLDWYENPDDCERDYVEKENKNKNNAFSLGTGFSVFDHGVLSYCDDGNGIEWDIDMQDAEGDFYEEF